MCLGLCSEKEERPEAPAVYGARRIPCLEIGMRLGNDQDVNRNGAYFWGVPAF